MIISHKHKFLFVELPLTASTAISRELRANYGGEKILFKHATYQDFLRVANSQEREYFVFSGLRNPLDKAVSHYFKYKTDHHAQYSQPQQHRGKKAFRFITDIYYQRARYRFISESGATFPVFFKKFYRFPYSDWSIVSHKQFESIIRFENLQADFARTLDMIGASIVRPLPMGNKTAGKEGGFISYYTPEIIPLAKKVFGPYMEYWGYEFPDSWGPSRLSAVSKLNYELFTAPRFLYWKYFRNRF
jgi:hypothetical protein